MDCAAVVGEYAWIVVFNGVIIISSYLHASHPFVCSHVFSVSIFMQKYGQFAIISIDRIVELNILHELFVVASSK